MSEYCASCGRCKHCGAKAGSNPTIMALTPPNAVAAAAAPTIYPFTVEVGAAGGAATLPACEHFEKIGRDGLAKRYPHKASE